MTLKYKKNLDWFIGVFGIALFFFTIIVLIIKVVEGY